MPAYGTVAGDLAWGLIAGIYVAGAIVIATYTIVGIKALWCRIFHRTKH